MRVALLVSENIINVVTVAFASDLIQAQTTASTTSTASDFTLEHSTEQDRRSTDNTQRQYLGENTK